MVSRFGILRGRDWRRFKHSGKLAASAVLLAAVAVGGFLAMRALRPATVAQALPGQALAWDIARAAGRSGEVQLTSGAYMPGDALLLYTRTTQTDRARVRTWALMQLEPFAQRLAAMPKAEKFRWVIDFGPPPAEQEVLMAPLSQAANPTLYSYVSAAPGLFTADGAPPQPAVAAQTTAAPAAPQPTAAPAAPQPTAAPAAPQPTAVPANGGNAQPLLSTNFDEAGDLAKKAWLPLSGDWLAHDGIYSQRDGTGYDYISMVNLAAQSHYSLEAKLRLAEGDMGGGFIYNAPSNGTRNGAQTVDFDNKGGFLRWGRYDAAGAYVYSGGVKVDPPINDGNWHTLRLVTHASSSVVSLDGKELGTIENASPSGYYGLITSKSKVDFDSMAVVALPESGAAAEPAAAAPTAAPTPAASTAFNDDFADGDTKGWQVLSGTWQNIDGTYQQTNISGSDFGSVSPFASDHFSATVRLKRIDGDMGGGMYFNMAQPDKKSRSQMINYTQNGQAIQWGHFDEGGNFVFEGSANVPNGGDGQWHVLNVRVQDGSATFTLDGKELAKDVKLVYASGYAGLMTSNSKVAFDDVKFVVQ